MPVRKQKPVVEEKVEVPMQKTDETPECKNHFGYLSERNSKDQIPDECMTCRQIVQCMLKKAQP